MKTILGLAAGATVVIVAQRTWRRALGWALSRGDSR